MISGLDISDWKVAGEVLALQKESYAVEAEIVGCEALPPLGESEGELRESGEIFFGEFDGEVLIGAASCEVEVAQGNSRMTVCRLFVSPKRFGEGVGRRLLRHLEDAARDSNCTVMIVGTGRENSPAVRLYESFGFRATKEREVVPGLWLVNLEKRLSG